MRDVDPLMKDDKDDEGDNNCTSGSFSKECRVVFIPAFDTLAVGDDDRIAVEEENDFAALDALLLLPLPLAPLEEDLLFDDDEEPLVLFVAAEDGILQRLF